MTAQRQAAAIQTAPSAAAEEASGPFVLNLCSSTTPMALTQPQAPELKRFSFFVSRRREDGRERFRLHMGHFATLAEAEEWLNVVRDIYPGAWAGEAPGKRLRERAAAAAAAAPAAPAPAAAPAPVAAAPVAVVATPATPAMTSAPSPAIVPTLKPAAPVAAAPVAAPAAKPEQAKIAAAPSAPSKPVAVPKPAAAAKPAAPKKAQAPGSNIREVLKSLDDQTGETRLMPSLTQDKSNASNAPASKPAAHSAAAATRPAQDSLSDSQVLRILEDRRVDGQAQAEETGAAIELLRPDDTGTCRALKEAVNKNEAVSFAVQLQWAVQPIDPAKMPPLAIFSAYTLYTVEGSRDGRKWYGLRLGFFSDAISAKQVASYVRSEFASVAVIPVSAQERGRATESQGGKSGSAAVGARSKHQPRPVEEFKLIDHTDEVKLPTPAKPKAVKPAAPLKPIASGRSTGRAAPAQSSSKGSRGKVVHAKEKRSAQTLEETLEILGASELQIDNGRGELLNNSGVRHLSVEHVRQKNSPFAKLLERLSEKTRKS